MYSWCTWSRDVCDGMFGGSIRPTVNQINPKNMIFEEKYHNALNMWINKLKNT